MTYKEEKIVIGGIKQSILSIYTSLSNPILLILHGGPGSPDRPLVSKYNSDLANDFTIVCWDQRCSGLSYTRQSKREPLTVEIMISDLKELVKYLLKKYNQDKLYLAGHSWGAYLGLYFVSRYPELIYHYIGTGQGISSKIDEIEKYNFVLEEAKKRNEDKVIKQLSNSAPVNGIYQGDGNKTEKTVGRLIHKYGGYINDNNDFSSNKILSIYLKYYKHNIIKVVKGISYSVKYLTPKMKHNDVIPFITKVDVPILLIFGEKDYICPVSTAKKWFDKLNAPKKEFVIIENASHMVNFEQPKLWNSAVKSCKINCINKK